MVEIVKSGGWLMAPIILCAIIAMGIILERFWTLQQKRVIPEDLTSKVWGWVKRTSSTRNRYRLCTRVPHWDRSWRRALSTVIANATS